MHNFFFLGFGLLPITIGLKSVLMIFRFCYGLFATITQGFIVGTLEAS